MKTLDNNKIFTDQLNEHIKNNINIVGVRCKVLNNSSIWNYILELQMFGPVGYINMGPLLCLKQIRPIFRSILKKEEPTWLQLFGIMQVQQR